MLLQGFQKKGVFFAELDLAVVFSFLNAVSLLLGGQRGRGGTCGKKRDGVDSKYIPQGALQSSESSAKEYNQMLCDTNAWIRQFLKDMKLNSNADDLVSTHVRCDN